MIFLGQEPWELLHSDFSQFSKYCSVDMIYHIISLQRKKKMSQALKIGDLTNNIGSEKKMNDSYKNTSNSCVLFSRKL